MAVLSNRTPKIITHPQSRPLRSGDALGPNLDHHRLGGAAPACYDAERRATHRLLDRKLTVIPSPKSTLREEDARAIGNGSHRPTHGTYLTGTVVSSVAAGDTLGNREIGKPGSSATDMKNTRCGTSAKP